MFAYVFVNVCVYVCTCVCERERGGYGKEPKPFSSINGCPTNIDVRLKSQEKIPMTCAQDMTFNWCQFHQKF